MPGAGGASGVRGLNNIAWRTVNDLYRYGSFNGGQTLDWSIGGNPCMSIDAGASCIGPLSTGRTNGDGRQASHWKDGPDRRFGQQHPADTHHHAA